MVPPGVNSLQTHKTRLKEYDLKEQNLADELMKRYPGF